MKYGECLKNLWKCAAEEESRFALQFIQIDAEKKVAVVTDGHCLAVKDIAALLEPKEKSFLLPIKALKAARALWMEERARLRTLELKEKDARPIFIRATKDAVTVYIGTSKRGQSFELAKGVYPNWEAVVERQPKDYKLAIMLSVGILLNLADAMRGNFNLTDGVCLHVKEPADPVIVSVATDTQTFGVMMPMRADETKVSLFWQKRTEE